MALLHDFGFICWSIHTGPFLPLEHVFQHSCLCLIMTLLLNKLYSIQSEGIPQVPLTSFTKPSLSAAVHSNFCPFSISNEWRMLSSQELLHFYTLALSLCWTVQSPGAETRSYIEFVS